MTSRELFEANLVTIERVIAIVCRRGGLFGADAEDFASEVRLALIEDDYAILARFEGRSSLDTFLTVVIQRLLADVRMREKGRWHASSEARRLGDVAVMVETLVRRDRRTLDEALPHIRASHPEVTREELAALLERLPARSGRPRPVDIESVAHVVASSRDAADARAMDLDGQRLSTVAADTIREVLRGWAPEDAMLLRLRFARDLSIADIARIMQLPQRPLYRRLAALLAQLGNALREKGIDAATVETLIGRDAENAMDFGLGNGKSGDAGQSIQRAADHAGEEL